MSADTLINSIESKTARIGIIGLGYVGIPLMIRFSEIGFPVLGFDVSTERVDQLNSGTSPIEHISGDAIKAAAGQGFEATTDYSRIDEVDTIIICVPTPLNRYREPDMSFIVATMDSLVPHIRQDQLLTLESTTYPGTTDELIRPYIEGRGFTIGSDFFLAYSPEREDPGNANFETRTIPKVLGGVTPDCTRVAAALYATAIDKVVPVSSTKVAELTKLLENIHRAINIGLANEMKVIADSMDIDIFEVIDAAATKPFGFTPYYPGPGLGGHCIPIDPFYLTWKAREYGIHTRFIELAGEINSGMPEWVYEKVAQALNEREKPVKGSRILALGIAYKPDVDDMRESPSVFVMEQLRDHGAVLDYSDPHVAEFPEMREHHFDLKSVDLTPDVIASYDCVVVLTHHKRFDYDMILDNAQLVIDTRGVYREPHDKVVKA
ncbi:MAG: nucleotide sugar dehydrogenase [Pseudomonadota bacterium]